MTERAVDPRRPLKRHRTINSCLKCRARRVKCDKKSPQCSRCAEAAVECVYDDSSGKAKRRRESNESRDLGDETSKVQLQDPKVVNPIEKSNRHSRGRGQSNRRDVIAEPLDAGQTSGVLRLGTGGRSRYIATGFWAYVKDGDSELDLLLQSPYKYVGVELEKPSPEQAPAEAFLNSLAGPNGTENAFSSNSSPSVQASQLSNLRDPKDKLYGAQASNLLAGLLDQLPPKKASDTLYSAFLDNFHAVIPLLYLPQFHKEYTRFWKWYATRHTTNLPCVVLAETPSFLCLLYAVLYAGAYVSPISVLSSLSMSDTQSPAISQSRSAILATLQTSTRAALSLFEFPRTPAVYSLSAFLILQIMIIREEEALVSCSFINTAVRVGQIMGLHRDGKLFGLEAVQTEVRRRLWCMIIHMDVMVAVSSGLPPVLTDRELWDTEMIGEGRDEFIGDDDGDEVPVDKLDVRFIIATSRYRLTSLWRDILLRQHYVRPMTRDDITTFRDVIDDMKSYITGKLELLDSVADWHATSIQPTQQHNEVGDNHESLPPSLSHEAILKYNEWGHNLLSLMVEKAYCLLYQPLMRRKELWDEFRVEAINHHHQFLTIFVTLIASPNIQPFTWLYPGMYQPLHALAVVLTDLYNSPDSEESTMSRVLVDRLFARMREDTGVVSEGLKDRERNADSSTGAETVPGTEHADGKDGRGSSKSRRQLSSGGKAVWTTLMRMRERAWAKAGLDPEFSWAGVDAEAEAEAGATDLNVQKQLEGSAGDSLAGPGGSTKRSAIHGPLGDEFNTAQTFVYPDVSQGYELPGGVHPVSGAQIWPESSLLQTSTAGLSASGGAFTWPGADWEVFQPDFGLGFGFDTFTYGDGGL